MSTTFSAIINRKEIPSQSFWTEWRQAAVSIGPAGPNDIVLLGVNGTIDPSLLPPILSSLLIEVNGTPTPIQDIANFKAGTNVTITADNAGGITVNASGSVATSFNNISSGTNTTAAMVMGSGSSLSFSGTGIVNANQITGVAITNTPSASNQTLVSTGDTTAQWQASSVYPNTYKTAQATVSGNTTLWTPASGKSFVLQRYLVEVTLNASQQNGGILTISFEDGANIMPFAHDFYIPSPALKVFTPYSSGWINLGSNGYPSSTPGNPLNINLSASLNSGNVRVIACGIEE
jgi:hypothetical protein